MNRNLRNGNDNSNENGRSFRVEIGSISRRCTSSEFKEGRRHSYSIGSFEYIVDDGYEVSGGALNSSIDKQNSVRVLGSELWFNDVGGTLWFIIIIKTVFSILLVEIHCIF